MSYFGAMGAMSKCWKCLVCRFDFVSAWDQFLKLVLVLKRLCPSKRNSIVKLMVVSWHNIFNQIGHYTFHIFTSSHLVPLDVAWLCYFLIKVSSLSRPNVFGSVWP